MANRIFIILAVCFPFWVQAQPSTKTNGITNTGFGVSSGIISPSAITGSNHNYNPTGLANASVILQSTSGGSALISGVSSGQAGRLLMLCNSGTAILTVSNEDAGSTNINRIRGINNAGLTLSATGSNACAVILYDGVVSRWRVISYNSGIINTPTAFTSTVSLGDDQTDLTTIWGHTAVAGTLPALSACGIGPTNVGTDQSGTISIGTVSTGCTLTFATPFPAIPICTVSSRGGIQLSYVPSITTLVITAIGLLSSSNIDYHCVGR